jgi:hypothetical protein
MTRAESMSRSATMQPRLGIDADHAPTVSVADLINTITATVVATLIDDEGLSARIGADLHSEVAALLGRAIKDE